MSYAVLPFETLLDSMLEDYRNRVQGANTAADTEIYIRCAVVAGAIWGLHNGLKYVENQAFPETSDDDNLDRWGNRYKLPRKAATQADDGEITIKGTSGTVVAAGLVYAHADGTTYTTTSGGTITLGALEVTAICDVAGTVGNKSEGIDILTCQSPPLGVDALGNISAEFTNGTDRESKAAYLERILARIRQGNAGGTLADYEQWALSVSGVAYAYALPLRRGAGTVDLAVFAADGSGNRISASSTIRTAVQAYIDSVRPVTADVAVPATTTVTVTASIQVILEDDVLLADVEPALLAAWNEAVYAVEPGGTLYLTKVIRAFAGVDGIADFTVLSPTGNTTTTVSSTVVQVLAPGALTVTEAP